MYNSPALNNFYRILLKCYTVGDTSTIRCIPYRYITPVCIIDTSTVADDVTED